MSSYVVQEVVKKSRSNILSFWAKCGSEMSGMGEAVENLFF